MNNSKKYFIVFVIFLSPLLPLLLAVESWFFTDQSLAAFIVGSIAYTYFMNSLILSTRLRWLDRLIGQDTVIRVHVLSAVLSLVLAIAHRNLNHMHVEGEVVEELFYARLGTIGLAIFILATVLTALLMINSPFARVLQSLRGFVQQRLKIGYGELKNFHNLLILAAIAIAGHVLLSFPDEFGILFRVYMGGLAIFAILRWLDFKLFKPRRLRRQGAVVQKIQQKSANIWEIWIQHPLSFTPGQFVYLRYLDSKLGSEEHPFSVSSAPASDSFSVTVKGVGDYTRDLGKLKEGVRASVDGPFGNFTLERAQGQNIVLVAGGIGITPFHSMLKFFQNNPESRSLVKSITLIWSVRKISDFVYDKDFQEIEREISDFRFIPVITDFLPGGDQGGMILTKNLEEGKPIYFFCGPPAMRKALFKLFKARGIPKKRIVSEKFSLGN